MAADRWERLKELLHAAAELPAEQREEFVARECGDDTDLRAEVDRLLKRLDKAGEFLEPPGAPESADPESDLPFEQLGDCRLIREIGSGGKGVVFLARQRPLGRDVAVKLLSPQARHSPLQAERFRREATATAKLHHPGIVPIYFVGEEQGVPYLVMDYVEGGNLAQEIEQMRAAQLDPSSGGTSRMLNQGGRTYPEVVAGLVKDVAEALQHAHEEGIVHRDVKPHNILLDRGLNPKLADFGLAKDAQDLTITRTGDIEGTPNYMSPEQVMAREIAVDHRTDVYSLGVVLYELLTLERPFEAASAHQILHNITSLIPRPVRKANPRIPIDLETICHKAIEKRPADRYQSAGEFAADLDRFLKHLAIEARPPTAAERVTRWVGRHRMPLAAAGLLFAGLLAGSWLGLLGDEAPRAILELQVRSEVSVVGAEILVHRMDPFSGELGPLELREHWPVDDLDLPFGHYRIYIDHPEAGFAELTRRLARADQRYEAVAWLRDPLPVRERMVPINSGATTLQIEHATGPDGGPWVQELRVELPSYFLDAAPVTNREYQSYLDSSGAPPPAFWPGRVEEDWADRPVTLVSLENARNYAEWAGKRLPTLAEWDFAARGPERRRYPWGDQPGDQLGGLNLEQPGWEREEKDNATEFKWYLEAVLPTPAAADGRSPLRGLLGNIWEWTETPAPAWVEGGLEATRSSFVVGIGCTMPRWMAEKVGLGLYMPRAIQNSFPETGFRCAASADTIPHE